MTALLFYRNPNILLCNMRTKVQERIEAIKLRKQGKSYREIQSKVDVSKGTLSKWFTNLPLTSKERKYLQDRSLILQDKGRLKTALKNKERNERRRELVRIKADVDFEKHKNDPFFVLGLSLYWAEGAKKNDYFSFLSSDVSMMLIMMQWSMQFLKVEPVDFKFRLYIHKAYKNENCERYWSRKCAVPQSQFQRTIYKPAPHSVKMNPEYKGCLRMTIMGVQHLLTIKTWQKRLSEYYIEAE